MITLKDIQNSVEVTEAALKDSKLTVEGSYVVDYKDRNGKIQLIRGEEGILYSGSDLVSVDELLKAFAEEQYENLPIADEDGKEFEEAAATKTKLNFKYE